MANSNSLFLSKIEVDAIKHRYQQGECAWNLADCFEVDLGTIRYHCRGLKRPKQVTPPPFDIKRARTLRAQGLSYTVIGARLGVAKGTIAKHLSQPLSDA